MKSRIVTLSALLLLTDTSYAGCKLADLKGTWITTQAAVRAEEPHVGHYGKH